MTIPNNVTDIGHNAFYNCIRLKSVTIPNSMTLIGMSFAGCTGLESIIVESGNKRYDSRESCNAIIETATNRLILGCKNSSIPFSVDYIDDDAFEACQDSMSMMLKLQVAIIRNRGTILLVLSSVFIAVLLGVWVYRRRKRVRES